MNETNFPENPLRSWRPRRPSTGLKRRIWSASRRRSLQLTLYLRWLAPATACLLLAISAVRQSDVAFHATAHNGPVQLMITSNQIAYVPETYQQQQRNTFPAVTFEWTNRNGSTSSIGSFLPGKVN